MTPKLHNIFPESCLLIVVGIIIGNIAVIFCNKIYDVIFVIQRRHLYEGDRPEIDIYFVVIFLFSYSFSIELRSCRLLVVYC
jgi:uncharacterized membrane protein SpoIIM required for sporulation